MRAGDHGIRLAEEEPHHVEDVSADIHDDQPFHFAEKRLILEHWKAVGVVQVRAPDPAERSCAQCFREGADLRLPAPVFVHEQRHAAFARVRLYNATHSQPGSSRQPCNWNRDQNPLQAIEARVIKGSQRHMIAKLDDAELMPAGKGKDVPFVKRPGVG